MTDAPEPGHDATKYLQDCADDDSMFGPGIFEFAKPVVPVFGSNLLSVGFKRSELHYRGYAREDGCIQLPAEAWGSTLSGFTLKNVLGTDRMGTGIRSGNTDLRPSFGTQSGTSTLEKLLIVGFETGIWFGNTQFNSSSSEVTLRVKGENCGTVVRIETQNSLNFDFHQFGAAQCDVALETIKSGEVHLFVGSFSNVGTVWRLSGAGVYSATGLRTENCGYLLEVGNELPTTDVTLIACRTNRNNRQDKVDVKVSGGVNLKVYGGLYDGMFVYEGFKQPEPGQGNLIFDGVRTRNPVLLRGTPGTKCRYECRSCAIVNAADEVIRRIDQKGIIGDDVVVP